MAEIIITEKRLVDLDDQRLKKEEEKRKINDLGLVNENVVIAAIAVIKDIIENKEIEKFCNNPTHPYVQYAKQPPTPHSSPNRIQ